MHPEQSSQEETRAGGEHRGGHATKAGEPEAGPTTIGAIPRELLMGQRRRLQEKTRSRRMTIKAEPQPWP